MATNKNIKINLDYSEFSGGINECQQKMKLLTDQFKMQTAEMGNSASEMDKLQLSESTLNQKIQLQEQVVAQLLEKWSAMAESEEATVAQTERAHDAWIKANTTLENLKNELGETEEKIQNVGDAEEELSTSTEQASSAFDEWATETTNAIGIISGIASAVSSAVSVIDQMSRSAATAADDIATLATKYSVSAETLDQWNSIAGITDVSVDTLGSSMSRLTREMEDAASGSSSSIAKFEELGVSFEGTDGHLRNTETVFYEVIDALGNMDNASERDAAAMDLLGRSAQDLNPIISMGSQAFQEMAASAIDVIPDYFADDLGELSNSFDTFDAAMERGQNELVGAFAPAISSVLNVISSLDPSILAVVSAFQGMLSIVSSLTPVITMLASVHTATTISTTASAAASVSDATAKEVEAAATTAAAASNTSFIASIVAAAPAIAEMLLSIAALVATLAAVAVAIAAVVYMINQLAETIKEIIELFKEDKKVTDEATNSALAYNSAKSGALSLSGSSSSSGSSTSYMASGSTAGGAGGLTWVGENGPELLNLPYGSTVYNNEQSTNMTRSTNNYYVTIDAKNVNDFNKVVNVFSGLGQSFNRGGLVNG